MKGELMSLKNILFPIASPERVKTTLPGVAHMINTLRADLTLMRVVDPFREGGPKPALHELKLLKPEEHGLVLLCYKIWIKSSPDQSWQAFQTGYRLREAMSPKLDLAGIPERRDTVVLATSS